MRILALDIGTSGVRAAVFDELGNEIPGASVRNQRRDSANSDFSLIDPDQTVALVIDTVDQLLKQSHFQHISLIAISCFWHSLVGVNRDGEATTPVLSWAETRAAKAVHQLRDRFDETETHRRTGCRFHPSYWPAKLLWLKQEHPEIFSATRRWLSFSEYLTLKLFASTSISVSMASGTGLMDQRTCSWDEPLLDALDIPVESLPEITPEIISDVGLKPAFAARWPQLKDALLCPAIADGAANNIGSGCTTRDKLALMIGTSGATRVLFAADPPDRLPPELWCYRADRKRVLVGGALSDGGGLYDWLRKLIPGDPDAATIGASLQALEPDAHGLTVLPFWAGERSTGWSLSAKGGILGITLETRPIEILRAAMEAVAYRFALILKALEPISPGVTIIAAGNALQFSHVWPQILADVLARPINLTATSEASTRGAALLALEATGKIRSIEDISNEVVKTYSPDPSSFETYQSAIRRQQMFYKALLTSEQDHA